MSSSVKASGFSASVRFDPAVLREMDEEESVSPPRSIKICGSNPQRRIEVEPGAFEKLKRELQERENEKNRRVEENQRVEAAWAQDKAHLESMGSCECHSEPAPCEMPIKSVLAAVQSYAEMCVLVRNATAHLSFWGVRYITVEGHKGSLSYDALAARVLDLLKEKPNFDETERRHGKTIAPMIDQLYAQNHRCHVITYLLFKIRRVFSYIFSNDDVRILWKSMALNPKRTMERYNLPHFYCIHKEGYNRVFDYYTEEQHKTTFKTLLKGRVDWIHHGIGPCIQLPKFLRSDYSDYLRKHPDTRWLPPSGPVYEKKYDYSNIEFTECPDYTDPNYTVGDCLAYTSLNLLGS
ncbi:MAG: hypothetical protein K1000chlam4_00140 [Chlamydiae bacterium]|nr:hypothetical protein [Chlamydiota bacterium]